MLDKDSFYHHKISLIRNIEFKLKKNKIVLSVDSISKEVSDYFNLHEEELNEGAIPLPLLL